MESKGAALSGKGKYNRTINRKKERGGPFRKKGRGAVPRPNTVEGGGGGKV